MTQPAAARKPARAELIAAMRDYDAGSVEDLLRQGADVHERDAAGETPLMWNASHGDKEVNRILIRYGADVNAKNEAGYTPLMLAMGNPGNMKLFIENGARLDEKNAAGKTALDIALGTKGKKGEKAAQLLREAARQQAAAAVEKESARHALSVANQQRLRVQAVRTKIRVAP